METQREENSNMIRKDKVRGRNGGRDRTSRTVPLGHLAITPLARERIAEVDVINALARHERGDWGELDPEDRDRNESALEDGYRLLSAYTDRHGEPFWIITEADRSATTVLLPEEH
jgi:hypothetical protein